MALPLSATSRGMYMPLCPEKTLKDSPTTPSHRPHERVVYLQPAGNSCCLKTWYNASFTTYMRGLCHGLPSRFLPARADRLGVGVTDALWAVAIGAFCSSPNAPQAAAVPGQALQKASALSGSHPSTLLCCL